MLQAHVILLFHSNNRYTYAPDLLNFSVEETCCVFGYEFLQNVRNSMFVFSNVSQIKVRCVNILILKDAATRVRQFVTEYTMYKWCERSNTQRSRQKITIAFPLQSYPLLKMSSKQASLRRTTQ